MESVTGKSGCGGEHAKLAWAFSANRNAKSHGQICHVESETKFSAFSSPHIKKVYVLKEGEGRGDVCPTLFFGNDRESADACAGEMQRQLGGYFRVIQESQSHCLFNCDELTVKRLNTAEQAKSFDQVFDTIESLKVYWGMPPTYYYDNLGGRHYTPGPFAGGMHFVGL